MIKLQATFNMVNHSASNVVPDQKTQDVLLQAAIAHRNQTGDRPTTAAVVEALQLTEKEARKNPTDYDLDSLQGTWQLCLTTGVRKRPAGGIKLGRGFYLPQILPATIAFTSEASSTQGTIQNQVQVGVLKLRFNGPCRYLEHKNLLAFDFTQLQIKVFDRVIFSQNIRQKSQTKPFAERSISELPFFHFFWVTSEAIAARGRGGGLALWRRVNTSFEQHN